MVKSSLAIYKIYRRIYTKQVCTRIGHFTNKNVFFITKYQPQKGCYSKLLYEGFLKL